MRTSKVKTTEVGPHGDPAHTRSTTLAREEGERVQGEEKRDVFGGGKGENVGLKTGRLEERVKEGEVFRKLRLKNRVREEGVVSSPGEGGQWGQRRSGYGR